MTQISLPSLPRPVSTKLSVAACHIDFKVRNLGAVEDSNYKKKIDLIGTILASIKDGVNLVVFPERSCSDYLIAAAKQWSSSQGCTIVCGTWLDPKTSTISSPVIGPGGIQVFEKKFLSPYDTEFTAARVFQGSAPGGSFHVEAVDVNGKRRQVVVGLLVCYDLRHFSSQIGTFYDTQFLVVPLFDRDFEDAQKVAYELAKKYVRTLLVNKAFVNVETSNNLNIPIGLKLANWLQEHEKFRRWYHATWKKLRTLFPIRAYRITNPSSAHGPINANDAELLSNRRCGMDRGILKLWEQDSEAVVHGLYEVGVPNAAGSQNPEGAGFFYNNVTATPISIRNGI